MATIADKMKELLEAAWAEAESDPWKYTKVVATCMVDFMTFTETALRKLFERQKALEAQLAGGTPASPVAVQGAESSSTPPSPSPAPNGPVMTSSPSGMVRLGANDEPLSPKDQADEERMDMATQGKIDTSRYVPADSVARAPQ